MPKMGKYAYGIGGLTTVAEVAYLLLFLPLFSSAHVNGSAVLIASFIGLALPCAAMPIVYGLINGSTLISVGRYHLPMIVSGLLGSLSFVLMLGLGAVHPVLEAFAVFGLSFAFSLFMQIYSFCYFSVGRRLDAGGVALRARSVCNSVAMLVTAAVTMTIISPSRDSVRAAVAFAAIVSVVACVVTYMTTADFMPSFIRLEPRHKRGIRESYRRFFAPLSYRCVRVFGWATLTGGIAFFVGAAALPVTLFGAVSGFDYGYRLSVAVMAVTVTVVSVILGRLVSRGGGRRCAVVALAAAGMQIAAGAAVAVLLCLSLTLPTYIAAGAFLATVGVSVGASFAAESGAKEHKAVKGVDSPGRYHCLRNIIATLGFALGAAFTVAVSLISQHMGVNAAAVTAVAVYAVFALVSAVMRSKGYSLEASEETTEVNRCLR